MQRSLLLRPRRWPSRWCWLTRGYLWDQPGTPAKKRDTKDCGPHVRNHTELQVGMQGTSRFSVIWFSFFFGPLKEALLGGRRFASDDDVKAVSGASIGGYARNQTEQVGWTLREMNLLQSRLIMGENYLVGLCLLALKKIIYNKCGNFLKVPCNYRIFKIHWF